METEKDQALSGWGGFFRELKRRRVYHVAAAYAAAAFVLSEAASIALPALGFPDWAMTAVVVAALAGFPVALVLSWAFDLGPRGPRRTRPPDRTRGAEASDGEEREGDLAGGRRPPRSLRLAGLAAVVTLVGAGVWWFWPGPSLAFSEGDALVVADFQNATGDTLFDESLGAAFRVALQQSPFLNVYSEKKVEDVLRRMRRDPREGVTPEVAREIARREGLPAVVVPGIAEVGGRYVLTFSLQDPASGEVLAAERVRADGSDQVLDALDELALRLRDALGESREGMRRHHRKLAEVTTRSLSALELYSLGNERLRDGEWADARRLFGEALAADSSFTAARASLGMVEYERFDRERGRALLERAVENRESLTEYEALGIRAFYADAVQGDLEEAARIHRALTEMYPSRAAAHHNLGWALQRAGRPGEAIDRYARALEIDPALNLSYWGLSTVLFQTGRVDSTRRVARWKIARDSGYALAWDQLGWALLASDSVEGAVEAYRRTTELAPEQTTYLFRLGHAHRLAGRPGEAAEAFRRVLKVDSTLYGAHYQLGLALRRTGEEAAARRHLEAYRTVVEEEGVGKNPGHAYNHIEHALGLIRLGREEDGVAAARRAMALDSASADVRFGMALVSAARGREERAVSHLEEAFERGYTNVVWAAIHPDLAPLYDHPGFRRLIESRLRPPETGGT